MTQLRLTAALGRYPHTEALRSGAVASPTVGLDLIDIDPVNRAFAPMVRAGRFDVSEMAIATFLQAIAYGKGLVLLPVAMAARFQESAMICRADSDLAGPASLKGRRVGVRAYSQTTGLWLRGILQDEYGIPPDQIDWVVFEGAHVAEYNDPPWVRRAPADASLLDMLRDGSLDAAIMGNDLPSDPAFRTVFPDPAASAQSFLRRHGFMPVNHLVTIRRDMAEAHPEVLTGLMRLFRNMLTDAPNLPVGRAACTPSIALAIRYATEQGLLPRPVSVADAWAGLSGDAIFD